MKKAYIILGCIVGAIILLLAGDFIIQTRHIESTVSDAKADEAEWEKNIEIQEKQEKKIPIYNVGDTVESLSLSYTVTDVKITKNSSGYHPPNGMMPLSERSDTILDENDNILNEYSYVLVYLTVKNTGDGAEGIGNFSAPNLRLLNEGKQETDMEHCGEFQYFGTDEPYQYGKDSSIITIEPGASQDFVMIFVQRDDEINGQPLYLNINPQGGYELGVENTSVRRILLASEVDGGTSE